MVMDRRFPELARIDELPRNIRRGVESVCRRCDCHALWNRQTGQVHFYRGVIEHGVWQQDVGDSAWSDSTIDYVVSKINQAKMPYKEMCQRKRWKEKDHANAVKEQHGKLVHDGMPQLMDRVRYNKNRQGMGKKYTPSIVVDGSKGSM